MGKKFIFFKEALKNYKTSGTIIPSSKFLTKKMLRLIDFKTTNLIIELGPGNGVITHQILNKLNSNAILICFEVNNVFYKELLKINNPQLKVFNISAENIDIELKKTGYYQADVIISSLPLAIIPKKISQKILFKSRDFLKKNGHFIQYQYSLSYFKKIKKVFLENISLDFELLNFPPAFIYVCTKK